MKRPCDTCKFAIISSGIQEIQSPIGTIYQIGENNIFCGRQDGVTGTLTIDLAKKEFKCENYEKIEK